METRCKHCEIVFSKKHFNQKYCSITCKMRLYTKRYQERIARYNKKYYAKNTNYYSSHWRRYYDKNKDSLNERWRERYYRLKKVSPELIKRWGDIGRKRYRNTENGKLVRKLGAHRRRTVIIGSINKDEWLEKLKLFGGKCAYCGSSEKIQIDHIVPVSKGGNNHINNLQPLCLHCNTSKGSKIKDEEKVRHS